MDREMLKRHLAQAEEHIATGDKNIARQRDVIAQLERDGHHTGSARAFLREFEQLQATLIAERERLLHELSEL
jgi:exonuclease III